LPGRTVTWTSSAPAVATVSTSGLLTGLSTGTATITASGEGQSGAAAATVAAPLAVASVAVSPTAPSLAVGATAQLSATPQDSSGYPLSGRTVSWASSAPAVATVSGSGLVTGMAAGTATITATSEGKNGTAAPTVTAPPAGKAGIGRAARGG